MNSKAAIIYEKTASSFPWPSDNIWFKNDDERPVTTSRVSLRVEKERSRSAAAYKRTSLPRYRLITTAMKFVYVGCLLLVSGLSVSWQPP